MEQNPSKPVEPIIFFNQAHLKRTAMHPGPYFGDSWAPGHPPSSLAILTHQCPSAWGYTPFCLPMGPKNLSPASSIFTIAVMISTIYFFAGGAIYFVSTKTNKVCAPDAPMPQDRKLSGLSILRLVLFSPPGKPTPQSQAPLTKAQSKKTQAALGERARASPTIQVRP